MTDRVIILAEYRPKPPDNDDREVMLEMSVYANGDGTLWVANRLQTTEQLNWAIAQMADCLAALVRTKAERTGKR